MTGLGRCLNHRGRGRSLARRRGLIAIGLAALCLGSQAAPGQIRGRIKRVGLFEGATPLVRDGEWSFIEVELRYNGVQPFDGALRVEQQDRDGDVVISMPKIALTPDGKPRAYAVYFVPSNLGSGASFRVQVLDGADNVVTIVNDVGQETDVLVAPPVTAISTDELLIVDLSVPRKLAHVNWLDSRRNGKPLDSLNLRTVRGMSPTELPSRWQGLAPVDAIVWDDADPGLASPQQLDALVEWVRNGGRLLITSGSNWQALINSPLARVLPVAINGVRQTDEALAFRDIIGPERYDTVLDLGRAYMKNPITRCEMARLPGAIDIPRDSLIPDRVAYRRMLGRGLITFVGASLRQLMPPTQKLAKADPAELEFLDEPPGDLDFVRACEDVVAGDFLLLPKVTQSDVNTFQMDRDLFRTVRKSIGFARVTAAFLVFAVLFAVGYTLFATVGNYWYLKRKSKEHLCWTAFAVTGVVGSLVGTGMVWTIRGFGTQLWQTTVVDAHAGRDLGQATCLFGVKTPKHTQLDLRLPIDGGSGPEAALGSVRVMPESQTLDSSSSKFVAPESYLCVRAGAELLGVPQRATLKEYLGTWQGPIGGTLEARLVLERRTEDGDTVPDVGAGSFIRNNLGVDLEECFLIDSRSDGHARRPFVVHCHSLGTLLKDAEWKDEELRRRMFYSSGGSGASKRVAERDLAIDRWIPRWRKKAFGTPVQGQFGLGGRGQPAQKLGSTDYHYALLLLSTYDFLDPAADPRAPRLLRSHGRPLSCMHQLTPNTAILIGYARSPPGPRLDVNRTALRPSRSHTMYRFLIPVERP